MTLPIKNRTHVAIAVVAACTAAPQPSTAFDFTWTPVVRTAMRIDDNIRGASANGEDALGFDMGGGVSLKAQNDSITSEIFPRFNMRRFAVGEDLDADEYSVAFNNDWLQPYYTTGLDFSYVRDSTLTTELTDAGRQNDVTNRDSISVQPSASYFLTDKLALQSSIMFNDVAFIEAATSGFFDFRFLQGSAGISYKWREDLTTFANFFVSDFDVKDQNSTTRTYGGQTGATWIWDETFEVSGALGWVASNIQFTEQQLALAFNPTRIVIVDVPAQATAAGPIASVTLRKIFDRTIAKFDYSRQVSPSGRGSQSTGDRISLALERKLSDNLSLLFDGLHEKRSAQSQEINPGLGAQDLNRDYTELRGAVRYRLTKLWTLGASYRHGRSQSTNLNSSSIADINTVFLTVDYNGLPNTFWNGF
jgi:hypothetical protein